MSSTSENTPDKLTDLFEKGVAERFARFHASVNFVFEFNELFGHGGVEGNHRGGAVGRRSDGAELEAVAGEGEWRGAVAVGVVKHDFGNLRDVQPQTLAVVEIGEFAVGGRFDALENVGELRTGEYGDDCGGSFVGAETVGVSGGCDGCLE